MDKATRKMFKRRKKQQKNEHKIQIINVFYAMHVLIFGMLHTLNFKRFFCANQTNSFRYSSTIRTFENGILWNFRNFFFFLRKKGIMRMVLLLHSSFQSKFSSNRPAIDPDMLIKPARTYFTAIKLTTHKHYQTQFIQNRLNKRLKHAVTSFCFSSSSSSSSSAPCHGKIVVEKLYDNETRIDFQKRKWENKIGTLLANSCQAIGNLL